MKKVNCITLLCFDPGFTKTGYCVMEVYPPYDNPKLVITHVGEYKIAAVAGLVKYRHITERYGKRVKELDILRRLVNDLIELHAPDFIAHEAAFFQMSRVEAFRSLSHWVIEVKKLCYRIWKMPTYELAPRHVKKMFSGSGKSDKIDMKVAFDKHKELTFSKKCDLSECGEHARDSCGVAVAFVKTLLLGLLKKHKLSY